MKYRTKLFLLLSSLVMMSTSIGLCISYIETKAFLFSQMRAELTTLVTSSAVLINGDQLALISSKESTSLPIYQKIIKQLRQIRNNNRRDDLYVNFVSIVREISPKKFIFIADAEEDPKIASHFGDRFIYLPEFEKNKQSPFSVQKIFKDEFGQWLAAFAPIKNSHGEIEGYLGVAQTASLVESQLRKIAYFQLSGLLLSLGFGFLIATLLARQFSLSLEKIMLGVKSIAKGDFKTHIELRSHDELRTLSQSINTMAKSLEEKQRITQNFSRYVSKHVLDQILSSKTFARLEGEKKKITVLFSDIKEFTQLSESLTPEDLVSFLNEYFENMIKIIFKYQGTLDKFIGDGIMAEFGIPLEDSEQELHAIKAAIEMQQLLKDLSQKWKGKAYETIHIGIGIHTGDAVIGNIGSSQRMEYTAIGDTVNTAARLESLTKEFKQEILISKETYSGVTTKGEILFEYLGPISLRGKVQPQELYAVKIQNP